MLSLCGGGIGNCWKNVRFSSVINCNGERFLAIAERLFILFGVSCNADLFAWGSVSALALRYYTQMARIDLVQLTILVGRIYVSKI